MTGGKEKKRREHHHPIDFDSDDHTEESASPTMLGTSIYDGDEGGDDRDSGPDHHVRRPPGHKHHAEQSSD
jgi:hypothetical protein